MVAWSTAMQKYYRDSLAEKESTQRVPLFKLPIGRKTLRDPSALIYPVNASVITLP
jgi:hypothetical protein